MCKDIYITEGLRNVSEAREGFELALNSGIRLQNTFATSVFWSFGHPCVK